ncbi:hypothetical protein [Haloferax sp. DFSO60]|uniref:DUF7546 family protein n=1 Tax=Haloferax sp. DFSO60 TaxID=3388652 RepID=UPI0039791DEA
MTTKHQRFAFVPQRSTLGWVLVLAWFEVLAVAAYLLATPVHVENIRYILYPFVWINLGLAAVFVTTPPTAPRRVKLVAGAIAVAYFLLLGSLAGMISVNFDALLTGTTHAAGHHPHGWQFTLGAPGWGPRIGYAGEFFSVMLVPYHVVGYLSLSYLVYAAVLDTARAAVPGVLGLVSCVGCAFPLAGAFTAGAAGGTGLLSSLRILSVDLSTLVFVVAIAVLVFRPTATGER